MLHLIILGHKTKSMDCCHKKSSKAITVHNETTESCVQYFPLFTISAPVLPCRADKRKLVMWKQQKEFCFNHSQTTLHKS